MEHICNDHCKSYRSKLIFPRVRFQSLMPATPLWIHRLAEAIPALETLPLDLLDRRAVEEALGVGKWTAWRIMRRCGATEGPGGALVCRREALIASLRCFAEDPRCAPEIARRERVERYLDGMLQYASRKHTVIARDSAAEQLLGTRLSQLPEGVDLQPRELRIQFSGTEDFLRKFGAVVYALHNDFERVTEFIDSASSPSTLACR